MEAARNNLYSIEGKINYHQRIKSIRLNKNLTQEYLAETLHLSQRAYSSIENGRTQLTVDRLYEIARVLDISISEIIDTGTSNFHTKSNIILHSDAYAEQKSLYERLLQAKDDEIKILKEKLGYPIS